MTPNLEIAQALAQLRAQIDHLDSALLQLLSQRHALVRQIGLHKADALAVTAYERLLPMLRQRGEQAATLGLAPDFIVRLFEQIAHQAMVEQRAVLPAKSGELPLVYSCSGCSSSAQLANDLAVALDREQVAEMSCIAGVGGDVPALVKPAVSGRPIIVIDGCSRVCAKKCLARHGAEPTQHFVLSKMGVAKRLHQDYHANELLRAKAHILTELALLPDTNVSGAWRETPRTEAPGTELQKTAQQ